VTADGEYYRERNHKICRVRELRTVLGFGIYHTWLGVARPWA